MSSDMAESFYEGHYFKRPVELLRHHPGLCGRINVVRQYRLPVGVADLVLIHSCGITIVELKREVIDIGAVGQVLRYMGSLKQLLESDQRYSRLWIEIDGVVAAPQIDEHAVAALHALASRVHYYQSSPAVMTTPFRLSYTDEPSETLECLDYIFGSYDGPDAVPAEQVTLPQIVPTDAVVDQAVDDADSQRREDQVDERQPA